MEQALILVVFASLAAVVCTLIRLEYDAVAFLIYQNRLTNQSHQTIRGMAQIKKEQAAITE